MYSHSHSLSLSSSPRGSRVVWYLGGMSPPPERSDPEESVYDENGIDRTLVRWMLSLTPTERLEVVQSSIDLLASVRDVPAGSR